MLPSISFCLNKISIRGIRNIYTVALFVTIQTESERERETDPGQFPATTPIVLLWVDGGTRRTIEIFTVSRGLGLTVCVVSWVRACISPQSPHQMTSSVELHTTTKTIERAMILECKQNHSLTRALEKSAAERNHGDESIFSIIIIQVGTLFQPYLLRSMQLSRIETKQ